LGGSKGRRAGLAAAIASLGTTYVVQRIVKPVFRRNRPHFGRDVMVVGIRTTDASFPSGHTASSFAAATAISAFYPKVSPLGSGRGRRKRARPCVFFVSDISVLEVRRGEDS